MQILKTGSTGAEVALLQLSLRRAQYSGPAPDGVFGGATKSALQTFQRSHGLTPDGIFGPATREAVERFQSIFGLPVTGVIDFRTWYRISEIYVAVTRIAELQ